MVKDLHVLGVVQAGGTVLVLLQPLDEAFGLRHAALGQRHRLVLLVDDVVARRFERLALLGLRVAPDDGALLELRDDPVDLVIEVGRFLGGARNDERRPRFVDENAVHLVDDREIVPALDVVRELELHVVAQVIEPELVVRAVGDVGGVRDLPLGVVELVLDDADGHAEKAVDAAHPLGVAPGQVVVHGHDVDALAPERVQVGRERGDERLALAGLHLGDLALVKHRAADELHVEVPHVQHAFAGFADDGERLDEQVVERFALGNAVAEFRGLSAELLVGERLHRRLQRADLGDERAQPFQFTFVLGADDFGEKGIEHLSVDGPRVNIQRL